MRDALSFLVGLMCLIGISLEPNTVAANEVHQPKFLPGDTFKYTTTWEKNGIHDKTYPAVYKYKGMENGLHVFDTKFGNQKPFRRFFTADLQYVKSEGRVMMGKLCELEAEPHAGQLFFPLQVGRSWQHRFVERECAQDERGRSVSILKRGEVVRYETTLVPAGTFKTYKVIGWIQPQTGEFPLSYYEYDYAPDVGMIVWTRTSGPGWSWYSALTGYELVPRQVASR